MQNAIQEEIFASTSVTVADRTDMPRIEVSKMIPVQLDDIINHIILNLIQHYQPVNLKPLVQIVVGIAQIFQMTFDHFINDSKFSYPCSNFGPLQ